MKWADLFIEEAIQKGVNCSITRRVNGWPETALIEGRKCYVKSIKFNNAQRLYFQGVDPKKIEEQGDIVLLCCGINDKLRDIFIITWDTFFTAIKKGEPINTYKPPKEYWQYKFRIKEIIGQWIMTVQRSTHPELDVSEFRFEPTEAIGRLKQGK